MSPQVAAGSWARCRSPASAASRRCRRGRRASRQLRNRATPRRAATGVTRALARYVVSARLRRRPRGRPQGSAAHAAQLGGLRRGRLAPRDAGRARSRALAPFSGPPQASVLGRRERMDILHASLMNGISSHVFDFDDTHLKTVIHPAGPVVSALLALVRAPADSRARTSSTRWCSASKWSAASATRCIPPTTIAAGTSPARPACSARRRPAARLLGLSEQQMVWALGLAATQPVGLREMFGIDDQELPSRARRAERPDRGAPGLAQFHQHARSGIEGKSGWANVLSTTRDYGEITEQPRQDLRDLAEHLQAVRLRHRHSSDDRRLHPAAQRAQAARPTTSSASISRVHPLVLELTGKKTPQTGLESKFSVYFAAALAIVRGSAGHAATSATRTRAIR